jgi:hypothetical protein
MKTPDYSRLNPELCGGFRQKAADIGGGLATAATCAEGRGRARTEIPGKSFPGRFGARWSVFCFLVLLAGCVTQRIVWSPDGKQAAVIAGDDLYLCDPEGNLSSRLLSQVSIVAWFRDSRRLAIARGESCTNWIQLAAALSPQTIESIRRSGAELLSKLQSGDPNEILAAENRTGEKELVAARLLFLRDEDHGAALKLLKDAPQLKDLKANLSTLVVARVDNGHLEVGPVLAAEIGNIEEVRVSPNAAAIAYTVSPGEVTRLSVVDVNGGQPARVVATPAAVYPDWSPDGNSLVYITAANTNSGAADVTLAVLARRRVVNENGRVEIHGTQDELAGLLFNGLARVRCLRDGRILFASEEWRLPVTTNDLPQRQQLFALDPERQSTLTRLVPHGTQEQLPASLAYFEVSPDEKRVAVGGDKSMVAVFTLASGNVELVQAGTDTDLKSIPCWRSATELCYIAVQTANTNQHRADVALWQDGKTRLISQRWPESVRKGLLDQN